MFWLGNKVDAFNTKLMTNIELDCTVQLIMAHTHQ